MGGKSNIFTIITDLLVGLLLVSQDIMEKLMIDFDGGSFLCKFLQFIKVR